MQNEEEVNLSDLQRGFKQTFNKKRKKKIKSRYSQYYLDRILNQKNFKEAMKHQKSDQLVIEHQFKINIHIHSFFLSAILLTFLIPSSIVSLFDFKFLNLKMHFLYKYVLHFMLLKSSRTFLRSNASSCLFFLSGILLLVLMYI